MDDVRARRPAFVLLNHLPMGDAPAWDIVVGDRAVHYLPADLRGPDAQRQAAEWLQGQYGDGGVLEWEPAGDTAFIGRWTDG